MKQDTEGEAHTIPIWVCDECGEEVSDRGREAQGTKYRHLPCGGRWKMPTPGEKEAP